LTKGHIAARRTVQLYSPGGDNMHLCLIHGSLESPDSDLKRITHRSWQRVPILYNWRPLPLKIDHSHETWTPSNTWSTSRSVQPFFAQLIVIDRQNGQTTLLRGAVE